MVIVLPTDIIQQSLSRTRDTLHLLPIMMMDREEFLILGRQVKCGIFSLLLSGQSTKEQFTSSFKQNRTEAAALYAQVNQPWAIALMTIDCAAIYSVKVRISQNIPRGGSADICVWCQDEECHVNVRSSQSSVGWSEWSWWQSMSAQ